ncbi:hypothetical protein Mapa_010771 [Marchantia paleacea]|nr:hypothetical protein Mapa_010771 [Marchantia paleacea]
MAVSGSLEMQMSAHSRLRFGRRKGRTKLAGRPRVRCALNGSGRASSQIGEENRRRLDKGFRRTSNAGVNVEFPGELSMQSSGRKVQSLLKMIKQQLQVQLHLFAFQSQASPSPNRRENLSLQQIRARRLRSLFALAQHFDDNSNAGVAPLQHCHSYTSTNAEEGSCQLEAKLSHMSI